MPTIAASPLWFAHLRPADGCIEGNSTIVRILTSVAAFAIIVASGLIALAGPPGADADELLKLPGRGRWRVLAGYNTATHTGTDPHALDLVRDDLATTGGTQLLAPVSGRIRFAGSSSGCIGIEEAHGATIHLCHVFAAAGLDRGDTVVQGQVLGTVAPDGAANNNGIAHVHMAIHVDGSTVPFAGVYALEGHQFPNTNAYNAYYGSVLASSQGTSTGGSGGGSGGGTTTQEIAVEAGDDFEVDQGATVTLTAIVESESEVLEFEWTQTFGPPVDFGSSGRSISFIAPHEPGATLFFTVEARGTFNRVGSDSIVVAVTGDVAEPEPASETSEPNETPAPAPGAPSTEARIVTGTVPNDGFGLFVFSGGTSADLVWASGCPVQTARFWATVGGAFVVYIPGSRVEAANAAWFATFPGGLPQNTPLLGRCY